MTIPWWRGWAPLIALPTAILAAYPHSAPRWVLMWAIALALYFGCKWLTWRRTSVAGIPAWRHAAYLLAWPGMDAQAFLSAQRTPVSRPRWPEWSFACAKLLLGIVLLFGVARLVPADYPLVAGWVGLAGIVFFIHFGVFHLLSCAWCAVGIEARPLMHWPLAAASLADFWGRRWNTAFRDLVYRFAFRPLHRRLSVGWATMITFLASGLIHDLVISVPAGGGFGLPTLYFGLHGAALLAERDRATSHAGRAYPWLGRSTAAFVCIAPAALLFHRPFIEGVVLPMLHAWRALP
ncbi:MAG: MBOAT family protein [Pirellulales bacterium]